MPFLAKYAMKAFKNQPLTRKGMIRIKDHKQSELFDPWNHLSPKRRVLLEKSWAGLFRKHLLSLALLGGHRFGHRIHPVAAVMRDIGLQHCQLQRFSQGYIQQNAFEWKPRFTGLSGVTVNVFVDAQPLDGNMDDINDDGHINKADANYLYDYAQKLYANVDVKAGGLGSYKANAVHGPFVHIDARGRAARWGR